MHTDRGVEPGRPAAGGYGGDMAYAHQAGHSGFVRAAAPAVLEHLRSAGIDHGLVVDLGCGTGVLARELLRAGYAVMGVDLSADMIRLARQTAPRATFVHGSFFSVPLPRCAAVTGIGQSFGYAFDTRNSAAELGRLFRRIWHALRPGGILVFDLNAPAENQGDGQPARVRDWRDTPEWTLIAEGVTDPDRGTLTREITLFRRVGEVYRRTDERHVVLVHEPADVLRQLDAAGYAARRLDGYGDSRFPAELAAYLAAKPAE